MSRPGMAATDTFDAQPDSFKNAPFVDGFDGVLRASRGIAAVATEMRRDRRLVKTNGQDKYFFEHFFIIGRLLFAACFPCT